MRGEEKKHRRAWSNIGEETGRADSSPLSELTSGASVAQTIPLESTYQAGFQPTAVSGAPALPAPTLVIANYPALDVVPPTNSSEVQQWLSQVSCKPWHIRAGPMPESAATRPFAYSR
jgi:hypothetical protein